MAVENPHPFTDPKGSTVRQIALAILDCEEADDFSAALSDALLAVDDPTSLMPLMTGAAAALAFVGDITPRTVYEKLFSKCPSDENWQGIVERWREYREERGE